MLSNELQPGIFNLCKRDVSPRRELSVDVVETLVADPPISGDPPTLEETRNALEQLKLGHAA